MDILNKEKEYERLRKEYDGWIPHEHRCEIEMVWGKKGLKERCPYTKRQLKKECYCQCDECTHMIYIVFIDDNYDKILFIDRLQDDLKEEE